jgi:hypothetical protein
VSEEDDVRAVTHLVRGAWVTLCLRAAVELGLPDAMDAPYDVTTLADRVGADPDALLRLVRTIADADLMMRDGEGRWSLSNRGVLLRSDHPSGLANLVRMQTWAPNILTWERLADAVRTGRGMFAKVNGAPVWEALSGAPEEEGVFNAAMARRGGGQAASVLEACDFTGVGLVVDVGGGSGALLEGLLTAHPDLRGIVADRPDVAAEAERRMAEAGLSDRFESMAADFFASVPGGGDAYVLSSILHDWTDEECVRILRVVHAGMPPGARLWVVEKVLDPDPPRPAAEQADLHLVDLNMLVLFGARERSSAEYDALLTAAGFDPPVVHAPSAPWNVVESTRR